MHIELDATRCANSYGRMFRRGYQYYLLCSVCYNDEKSDPLYNFINIGCGNRLRDPFPKDQTDYMIDANNLVEVKTPEVFTINYTPCKTKIEPIMVELDGDYDAEVTEDEVIVGCRSFTFACIDELMQAVTLQREAVEEANV